jgi:hypothetical protein
MRAVTAVFVSALLVGQAGARVSGQTGGDAQRFIGTWRIVSDTQVGLMYYDSVGNMAAQVMPTRPRAKFAAAQPTPEEAKDALTGYLAYFGTYTVDERAKTITHHRRGNINPGQIGDDVVRAYVFETPDRMIYTPAGSTNKIIWERMK